MSAITAVAAATFIESQAGLAPYMASRLEYARELGETVKTDVAERINGAEGRFRRLKQVGRAVGSLAVPATFGLELTIANETVAGGAAIAATNATSELIQSVNDHDLLARGAAGAGAIVGAGLFAGTVSYLQQRFYGRVMRGGLSDMPKTVDFLAGTIGSSRDGASTEAEKPNVQDANSVADTADPEQTRGTLRRVGDAGSRVLKWLRYPDGWTATDTLTARTAGTSLNLVHANVKSDGGLTTDESRRTEHGSALAISRVWALLTSGVVGAQVATAAANPELMETTVNYVTSPQLLATVGVAACVSAYGIADIRSAVSSIRNAGDESIPVVVPLSEVQAASLTQQN